MLDYIPVAHITGHDGKNRDDQQTWNLVGNDPTVIKLRSSSLDISYFLGDDASDVFDKFTALYEEALYDRLVYD